MGDYTDRTSLAELSDDAALSANFTLPKHQVGSLPTGDGQMSSHREELEQMMAAEEDDSPASNLPARTKTGGRQKGTPNKVARFDLQKACKLYGLRAVATIVEVMEGEASTNTEKLAAAKELLDRGYGKAKQVTEISGIDGEEIQSRLIIEFVGQPPVKAVVDAQIEDQAGRTIDMQLETVRVPEKRRPWDPQ